MALHGLDRDGAPDPDVAKKMLDEIGGTWWNVYIGGPESGGSGWTPSLLRQYEDRGINHFLLSYVGRQSGHVSQLTVSQGEQDGAEACQLAERFGFAAAGTPVCLDLEGRTYDAAPDASLDYAGGWCQAVRSRGFRAGVYSNPRALIPLHGRASRPDWVWIASWVRHTADSGADPHQATGVADDLWPGAGQRAWQYAGTFGDGTCSILGLSVDIGRRGQRRPRHLRLRPDRGSRGPSGPANLYRPAGRHAVRDRGEVQHRRRVAGDLPAQPGRDRP
jgi:hypothetical protein